ncbi:hypothetical protein BSKO_11611 [Bryopsis sp. KO-2023]|nr:hypothetical protein BSKO_11611 [Bryopsis sp. KO-2023]
MPPKLGGLKIQVDCGEQLNASFGVEDTGTINVLTKSMQKVSINHEGLKKDDQHYKFSEADVRILKRLGDGASSVVHKGFIAKKNEFVAIKRMNVFDRETRHQLMNDLKALCDAPATPELVKFHGAYHDSDAGQISIVLDYMDGGSLGDILEKVGCIPEKELSHITRQVLKGLVHLHRDRHMVHRDIKPANILLSLDGSTKISDFGISAFIDNTLAVCRTFLGTVTYMSPERIQNEHYSFPADIWSLGLALIECATGRYPYAASEGPLQLMIQVLEEPVPLPSEDAYSPELCDFVGRCMKKDPLERPTAEELLKHPFIQKHRHEPVGLQGFFKSATNSQDKLEDISIVFATNYYTMLNRGERGLKDLAALYSEQSVLVYEGESAKGRKCIVEKLNQALMMSKAFGGIEHEFENVDCQPLGNVKGSALISVEGWLVPLKASGSPISGKEKFYEMFVLNKSSKGEYFVANQMFRLLK